MAGKVSLLSQRCHLSSRLVDCYFLFLLSVTAINAQLTSSCDAQTSRVINGTCVRFGKIPWMVYIDLDTTGFIDSFCGGSLLDSYRVLTAAHCFVPKEGLRWNYTWWERNGTARLFTSGSLFVDRVAVQIGQCKKSRAFSQTISARAIHFHPEFRLSSGNMYIFDAAIIELASPAVGVSEFVNIPSGSARRLVATGKDGKVLGWGETEKGRSSKCLRQADVTIRSSSYCVSSKAYGPHIFRTDSMICAVGLDTDACRGDSGGPLLAYGYKKLIEVGITSFGMPDCVNQVRPTVFTKVSAITSWIESLKGCLPLQTANKITFNVHGRQPVGTRVSISCPTGYLLNGSRQLECLSNGSWSETKAQCIEICELAGLERGLQMRIVSWTDNARRADVCSTRQYIFINDSVEFACPCGFQLIGSSVRTCNGANDLSGSQPHCQDFLGVADSTKMSTREPLRTCWKSQSSSSNSVALIQMDLQSNSRITAGQNIILGPWNVAEIIGNIDLATDGYSVEIRLSGYYHVYSQVTIRPSQSRQNSLPISMTVGICGHPGADWTTCYWYRSTSSSRSTIAGHPATMYVGYLTKALRGDRISVALSRDSGSLDEADTYVGAYLVSQFD